jgi:butyryl-CoA dehydrogenase
MDFTLTEQQEMVRRMTKDFASKEITPIAAHIDSSEEFPRECIAKLAKLGIFGLLLPPPYGGTGPDKLSFFLSMEEIAAASASVAIILLHSSLAASVILAAGNDKQKARYLPAMAKGERLGALCATEPSGGASWALTIQATARADDDSYILNGSKCFISNGGEADIYVVMARTDPAKGPLGISGLIVEKDAPGFSFGKKEKKLGLRGDVTRELIFDNCRVPKANILAGGIVQPVSVVSITIGFPSIGATAVGVARAALDSVIEYVKQRAVTAGQALANFDGVQCAIAEMSALVEASRLLVYRAGAQPAGGQPDLAPGLMAGIFPCEAAFEVTSKALQLFGTYGYTADFAIERYLRDARGLMLVGQPVDVRKLVAGRVRLDLPPMGPPSGGPPAGDPGGGART